MPSPIPDYRRTEKRAIAVFGWSRTEVDMPQWRQAEDLGRLAAQNGFTVITGGYGGTMEAVSKGAFEVKNAAAAGSAAASVEVVGVVVPGVFPDRQSEGNTYLTKTPESRSMLHRIEQLITQSRYFVVLPGTLGTLQEFVSIWVQWVIHPSDLPRPVIVAFRDPWERCCQGLIDSLHIPPHHTNAFHLVDTPEEAIELIVTDAVSEGDNLQA